MGVLVLRFERERVLLRGASDTPVTRAHIPETISVSDDVGRKHPTMR